MSVCGGDFHEPSRATISIITRLSRNISRPKRRLFEGTGTGRPAVGVVNRDDAYGKQLAGLAARTLTYGLEPGADITTRKPAISFSGIECTAETPIGKIEIRSRLVGRTNVYNILAAIGAGVALDLPREVIASGIAQLSSVPGRFERIDAGQPFLVVVDYAHTDDALRNLLATAKELNPDGRIITLFGCGGDRDRTKRPLMGEAAGARERHCRADFGQSAQRRPAADH